MPMRERTKSAKQALSVISNEGAGSCTTIRGDSLIHVSVGEFGEIELWDCEIRRHAILLPTPEEA